MATIGENIKRIRKEKGLTQKQLGSFCKPPMADSAIRRYEAGKANPKLATVRKIAEALDCKLYELVDDWTQVSPEEWAEDMASTTKAASSHTPSTHSSKETAIATKEATETALESYNETKFLKKRQTILQKFQELNENGQEKAIEQVEMLTKIPEYRKDSK